MHCFISSRTIDYQVISPDKLILTGFSGEFICFQYSIIPVFH